MSLRRGAETAAKGKCIRTAHLGSIAAIALLAGCGSDPEPDNVMARAEARATARSAANQATADRLNAIGDVEIRTAAANRLPVREPEGDPNCVDSNGLWLPTVDNPCMAQAISDRAKDLSADAEEARSPDDLAAEAGVTMAGVTRRMRYEVAATRLVAAGYKPMERESDSQCANSGARQGVDRVGCTKNSNFFGCIYPMEGGPEPFCWSDSAKAIMLYV